jgi:preprotein translocase subunit Sec61beta
MPSKKRSDAGRLPPSRAGLSFFYTSKGQQRGIKVRPEFVVAVILAFIVLSAAANAFFK